MDGADVIVIGGGAMGVSCAHHLNELGATVRLIERDGIAQATSTCGAGFVAYWAGGYVPQWQRDEQIAEEYGIKFYSDLHAEVPQFAFRRAGSLYIGLSQDGWDDALRPIAEHDGIPDRQVLDATDAATIGEIIRPSGIVGGVYDPAPVQLVAADAIRALATRLRQRGVTVEEHRPVKRLVVEGGRLLGIETPHGPLSAGAVVMATAGWTNQLLRPLGVQLPYAAMGALRITTEPLGVPATTPMLLVPDTAHAWIREHDGGLLWGAAYTGKHREAFLDRDLPNRLEQLPMDGLWQTETIGRSLITAIPLLARYHDFTYAQGAPCYTPDLLPLIGEIPGVDGLYALTGDNEAGITHGPGYGRALAELLMDREPFIDIGRYSVDRFNGRFETARDVAVAVAGAEGGVFR